MKKNIPSLINQFFNNPPLLQNYRKWNVLNFNLPNIKLVIGRLKSQL